MVALTVILGLESAALARTCPGQQVQVQDVIVSLPAMGVAAPPAHLLRGPHLLSRQAGRYGVSLQPTGPLGGLKVERALDPAKQRLVAGTALTIVSAVLLANFLWMMIVGAVWLFGFYIPEAGAESVFPPQAALFPISFAFLIPGIILLPQGLKELKAYRAMESADRGSSGPGLAGMRGVLAAGGGGLPLVRF